MQPTIVSFEVQGKDSFGTLVCNAICKLSDGTEWNFEWFQNEVPMYNKDFVGNTPRQVMEIWSKRDQMYLRN